jgi:hypothetical protein
MLKNLIKSKAAQLLNQKSDKHGQETSDSFGLEDIQSALELFKSYAKSIKDEHNDEYDDDDENPFKICFFH